MRATYPASQALPERPVLAAFLLFVLVPGGAAVAVRFTYREMDPFWVGASRFTVAAAIFWVLAYVRRIPLPTGRALLGAVLYGTLTVGLAFLLMAWGLVEIPASTFQILMALVPLLTIFLSAAHGVETITRRGLVGSLLAVVGIGVTMGGASTAGLAIPRLAAILLGSLFIAEGGVLLKRFPANPPIMTNAIAMTVGAAILAVASLLAGEAWIIPSQTNTWIALAYLITFVNFGSFMLYLYVLGKWTASGASYGFVLVPLVTIVIAANLAGEAITGGFLIGAALVLAGVLVGALLPSKEKPAATEECKDRSGQVLPRCM
jgi:drug/metabolite transporter (DMT)-like permease